MGKGQRALMRSHPKRLCCDSQVALSCERENDSDLFGPHVSKLKVSAYADRRVGPYDLVKLCIVTRFFLQS